MPWNENTVKPEPNRKIEFAIKVRFEIRIGTWTGEVIRTPDEDLVWGIVYIWRYV